MTIPSIIAAYFRRCAQMIAEGCYYDNSVPSRCRPWNIWHGRDCSTFAEDAMNTAVDEVGNGEGEVNPCGNSFYLAELCYNTSRPAWMTQLFGPMPGTFVTYQQVLDFGIPCWGFRGSNWGRNEDDTGDGHVESLTGVGKQSVGAHSHATGVGWDPNGIDNHNLSFFAIPPQFLPELEARFMALLWKVQPQMQEHLNARLKNPQGGWWEGYADGRVDLLKNNGQVVHGGMIGPDAPHFAGRTLAQLKLRWYRPAGKIRRRAGYTIVSTSGETYEPTPQH